MGARFIEGLLKNTTKNIENEGFITRSRMTPEAFTSNRKLTFKNLLLILMSLTRPSVQTELDRIFKTISKNSGSFESVSKSAFTQSPPTSPSMQDKNKKRNLVQASAWTFFILNGLAITCMLIFHLKKTSLFLLIMSRKYKFRNPEGIYFISFATVYWIDVFIRNEYKDVLLESWQYCQKEKGLVVHAWVIMTSHLHMIISSRSEKLENIVRDMKSYTSRSLKECIQQHPIESRREWMLWIACPVLDTGMERAGIKNGNNNQFQFWQQHNKPIELYNNKIIEQKLEYLHNNPVEAGIVSNAEDYLYSSAKDYAGEKGYLDIVLLE